MDMFIMDKFIHQENLALFKKLIAEAKNDTRRKMLRKLLGKKKPRRRRR